MRILSILFFLFTTLYLSSCSKKSGCSFQDDALVAPSSEQKNVKAYLDSIGVIAVLNPSGFYYKVINPGSSSRPGLCSSVTVTYTGQLVTGVVFDQETDIYFTLGSLIDGWKKGLPLIENGGEIMLYIPPSLGYGANAVPTGTATIPPNSILIFDIKLLNVQ